MMRTRVQICCIATREEAAMAIDAGTDRIGLVDPMLVDAVEPIVLEALGRRASGTRLLQVLHVQDGAAVGELGGTGRVHDWSVRRQVVAAVDRPVILAGGPNPENISRGIRNEGRLDRARLQVFMQNVEQADLERATR
jgi:phosphoribosylanthranilate isomerase